MDHVCNPYDPAGETHGNQGESHPSQRALAQRARGMPVALSSVEMKGIAVKVLKVTGVAWCVLVVLGYLAVWLFSEHGGGLFSQAGFGETPLIALACLPGVGLIKLAGRMSGSKAAQA